MKFSDRIQSPRRSACLLELSARLRRGVLAVAFVLMPVAHLPAQFVISEFMAINETTLNDERGQNNDWIEIHNEGPVAADLAGWFLTDTTNNLTKWRFPSTNLAVNAYFVVFASEYDRVTPGEPWHTNFKLSGDGEYLALVEPDGVTIASEFAPLYPPQIADVSYGQVRNTAPVPLLGANVPARAYVPADDSLGLSWTEVEFDDGSWLNGTTAVGYDRQTLGVNYLPLLGLNIESAMYNINQSAYVRIPFTWTESSDLAGLTLDMRFEDGFIAYLNGVEVARENAPDPASWNAAATAPRTDTSATNILAFDITEFKDLLQLGDNLLAIHALNVPINSPDLLVWPELTGLSPNGPPVGRYFPMPTPGTANEGGVETLGPIIRNPHHVPEQPGDNENLQITAHLQSSFAPIASVQLKYRIMFGVEITADMFDDGLHGDGAADDGTFGATIPFTVSTPGEMVRWAIVANDTTGTNQSRLPAFTQADAPAYFGTVIRDTGLNNPLPVFHWFVQNVAATDTTAGTRCSVYYNGEFYDNVFCRVRGASAPSFPKKPYKFDFNPGHHFRFIPGQPRMDEINLNTTYQDKAYLRAPLSFETYRQSGVAAADAFNVRVQQNDAFYSVAALIEQVDETFMERRDLDANGALYKLFNGLTSSTSGVEKKSRRHENNADLQELINAVSPGNPNRGTDIFDLVDLPATISYLASGTISQDWDRSAKNLYLYRDTEGDGLWTMLPWDKDLTFGKAALLSDVVVGNKDGGPDLGSEEEKISHPFYGTPEFSCCGANYLMDAIYKTPATREMYLRRLRSLMDELLQPPGTPSGELRFEARLDTLTGLLSGDAALDLNRWGAGYGQLQSLATAIQAIKDNYLAPRRVHLYETHGVDNVPNYTAAVGIPHAQVGSPLLQFGSVEVNPLSGNQSEEYIELLNPNGTAVDISGWSLDGGVSFTFEPGTVIPPNERLYVSPDTTAFRARTSGPRGGQGLFVAGNYSGQLSARGETLRLRDAQSTVLATNQLPANPSDAQRYFRITEIMFHALPMAGLTNPATDLEFIELRNISTNVTLNLANVRLVEGISFNFSDGAFTQLLPGEHIIVVGNLNLAATLFGSANVAGQFSGNLDNGGERLILVDDRGEEILDFTYDNRWYPVTDGGGFSLVVVDEQAEPDAWDHASQWRPSGILRGSPGTPDTLPLDIPPSLVNEVLSRTDVPPPTDTIELLNPTSNSVSIGGWFLSDDLGDPQKYRIPDGTTIAAGGYVTFDESQFNAAGGGFAFSSLGDEAYLFSGNDQTNLTGYAHGFSFGAADNGVSFGRHFTSQGEGHFVAQSSLSLGMTNTAPRVGPLVISEIMYHPRTDEITVSDPLAVLLGIENPAAEVFEPESVMEYVELQNLSSQAIDLFDPTQSTNTWRLRGSVDYDFSPGQSIPGNGIMLIVGFDPQSDTAARAQFESYYQIPPGTTLLGPWDGNLGNNSDRIELQKPGAPVNGIVPRILVETVSYRDSTPWPAAADGTGSSLQRLVTLAYGNDPTNWFAAGRSPASVNVFNESPLVILTSPASGANFNESDTIQLTADASDIDGTILSVSFYSGDRWLAEVTEPPFAVSWTNAIFGQHTLTARAVDDRFAVAFSDPVSITVEAKLPTVTIANPIDGALLLNSQPITIVLSATDDDGFIALAEFYDNGVKFAELNGGPLELAWVNPSIGAHQLRAAATDNSGNRVFSETITVTIVDGFAISETLIATGSVWRYFDLGMDLGTTWREPSFVDASWSPGPAPLGYGDGDEATVVGYGLDENNKFITTYFRHAFHVANASAITGLHLEILRDDGAVVYLNGTEAFRTGMPDGPVTYTTLSDIVVVDGDESTNFFSASLNPDLIVEGRNLMAVEIHQRSGDSSDISFDLKLDVSRTFLAPSIVTQPISQVVDAGTDVLLSVSAIGTEPLNYQWHVNGASIPGQTSHTLTIPDVQLSDGGSYSVMITNLAGVIESEAAFLAVLVPGDYGATVAADAPIHYYRFNETSTSQPARDEGMPGGFDGSFQGGIQVIQSTTPLSFGPAAHFDGASGTFVDLGLFHPGDAITVEAWVRLASDARINSYHAIVARWDGSFELDIATDDRANLVVRNQSNAFGLVATPSPLARGEWHHLAGVYDAGLLSIHLNGVRVATQPLEGTLRNGGPTPDRVLIGGTRNGSSSSFNWRGLIDEVAIYDYAVPEHRLLAHYLAGLPAVTLSISAEGVISWPEFPPGLDLQQSDSIGPGAVWTINNDPRVIQDGQIQLIVPLNEHQRFYRLVRP